MYDYYRFTNDSATVLSYISVIQAKIDHATSILGTNPELGFFGGDERLGSYFENPSQPECQRAFEMLTIRTLVESSEVLSQLGQLALAQQYNQTATALIATLRNHSSQWWAAFGMHSFAEAVNAGFTTPAEQAAMMELYSNPVTLNSYAPFNNFFLLLALTRMQRNDLALGLVHRSWGGMLQLGGKTDVMLRIHNVTNTVNCTRDHLLGGVRPRVAQRREESQRPATKWGERLLQPVPPVGVGRHQVAHR